MPIKENEVPYLQGLQGVKQIVEEGIQMQKEVIKNYDTLVKAGEVLERTLAVHIKMQSALSRVAVLEVIRDSAVPVDSSANPFADVPDFVGATLLEANALVSDVFPAPETRGDTTQTVESQSHPAGTKASVTTAFVLRFPPVIEE